SSATAVARAPIGVVRADPDMRWLFEQAMRETWSVGRKRGVALADNFVEERLRFADGLHADMRASLLHDLEAGGKLEAPWLCGAVARMAREAGIDAPVNRAVFAALKPFVNGSARKASRPRAAGPAVWHDPAARGHPARAGGQRGGQARRAPRRPAARRRGGLRHPGRDRAHAGAAPVSLHPYHRSARLRSFFPPANDRVQSARHHG